MTTGSGRHDMDVETHEWIARKVAHKIIFMIRRIMKKATAVTFRSSPKRQDPAIF